MQKFGKLARYMRRTKSMLWSIQCMVWICSVVSCYDAKDYRTPYKNRARIALISKKNPSQQLFYEQTLRPDNDQARLNMDIKNVHNGKLDDVTSSTEEIHEEVIAVYYQKKAVLISPQCGCAYKYKIEKVTSRKGEVKIINRTLSQRNDSDIDVQIYYP